VSSYLELLDIPGYPPDLTDRAEYNMEDCSRGRCWRYMAWLRYGIQAYHPGKLGAKKDEDGQTLCGVV